MKQIVDLGFFPYSVVFCLGITHDKCEKYARKMGILADEQLLHEPDGEGCCWFPSNNVSLVWMEDEPTSPETIGLLVHECIHATEEAARILGFGSHEDAEEFKTYSTQHLVTSVLEKIAT